MSTTRHNFQLGTNPVRVAPGSPEDGLCVFCHTPHKGQASLLLWNHTMSTNNYTWADLGAGGRTTGGTTYPTNLRTWTGSTAKCLSCHDGTVSIGSLYWANATASINIPMTGPDVNAAGQLSNPTYIIPANPGVGTDLTGNHPVGVPYPYDNASSTYNGITSGVDVVLTEWVARPTGVKIFGTGGGGAPAAGAAGIECASCHNPHGTPNRFFLRVTTNTSQLCLSCHIK
ncbi:MAG: cytochrome c3 family protein [Myxococcaceae bacterium]|nr:cytochrome c3 family protein [Myxococcaceae bacterium]